MMAINNERKKALLTLLENESEQVLGLAYLYAKNMELYGVDVTKAWDSAVINCEALERAYIRGYSEGRSPVAIKAIQEESAIKAIQEESGRLKAMLNQSIDLEVLKKDLGYERTDDTQS